MQTNCRLKLDRRRSIQNDAAVVVVIVGGVGSIPGAALGALIIGLAEQLGSVYIPTYAIVVTFLIMVLVLALRPQSLLARR